MYFCVNSVDGWINAHEVQSRYYGITDIDIPHKADGQYLEHTHKSYIHTETENKMEQYSTFRSIINGAFTPMSAMLMSFILLFQYSRSMSILNRVKSHFNY
jgi:hypothetical protein